MLSRAPIKSPCVKICVVDPATGWCEGCFRTLQEIGGWMRYSPEERDRITAVLRERRRSAKAGGPPQS